MLGLQLATLTVGSQRRCASLHNRRDGGLRLPMGVFQSYETLGMKNNFNIIFKTNE
jgi:hypothetical protein